MMTKRLVSQFSKLTSLLAIVSVLAPCASTSGWSDCQQNGSVLCCDRLVTVIDCIVCQYDLSGYCCILDVGGGLTQDITGGYATGWSSGSIPTITTTIRINGCSYKLPVCASAPEMRVCYHPGQTWKANCWNRFGTGDFDCSR